MLYRQVGDSRARELILLGQTLEAPAAREMGLIYRVVTPQRLMPESIELARLASRGAPGAIARSKRLLDSLAPRPMVEELKRTLKFHLEARESGESREGMQAFKEKRPPRWGEREE
jgi:enoyl-CoA hydratase/carnithine racemase